MHLAPPNGSHDCAISYWSESPTNTNERQCSLVVGRCYLFCTVPVQTYTKGREVPFRSVLALFCQRTRLRRIAASASVRLLCCGKLFQRNALAPSEGKDGRYFLCLPSCTGRSPGFRIVAVYSGYRKHRSGRCKCAANCVFNCVESRCILTVRKCGDDSCTVEQLESAKKCGAHHAHN